MAFDKSTRNRLASFVSDARDLIADEFTEQFQRLYGISERGTTTPLNQLGHLDDAGLAIAALLRERIEYLAKTQPEDKNGVEAAVARLAREQAFTVLNRLAAIRMAEKRGFIVESVGNGYQSKGFKVFEQVAGSGLGDTYQRYRRYLYCLFDELAVDLGLLFDRHSPQGFLFPRESALRELLALLDAPDLDILWAEDETIGWIYQYWNDPAERKKMRDESAAPRNSRELAVRNQFFTPRYIVEFLTDNTLGRIWYEMTQGQTRLKDQCRYLVRRPNEVFLQPGETAPEQPQQDNLSQEQLLQGSVHIQHRPLKDPREIRMLDPACGSMHFGLYAFDLFEAIYDEAWEIAHGSDEARKSSAALAHFVSFVVQYPDKAAFLADVPRLIIEHNLHGIDIDPRAAQIAGLSLWLRAQRAWQQQGLRPQDRPRIRRSNIVCAEPMPGEEAFLDEFIEAHLSATPEHKLLGQLFRRVFDAMKLAGEAGSLLKIEEEIFNAVKEAQEAWSRLAAKPRELFGAAELNRTLRPGTQQNLVGLDAAVSELATDRRPLTADFWEKAEERIYAALQGYAERAEHGGYQRRLFADDAARGFAFIDLCRKRYDVALMNPPFGESPTSCKSSLRTSYPNQAEDLYCWFVQRGREFSQGGFVGVISSDSFIRYTDYAKYRDYLIKDSLLSILFDLGWEVLDSAYVSAATYVLNSGRKCDATCFIDLTAVQKKGAKVLGAALGLNANNTGRDVHVHNLQAFKAIDGSPFCFWFSHRFFQWVQGASKVRELLADHGIGAGPHNIFFRLIWEVPSIERVDSGRWPGLVNGGAFSPYYRDDYLCIDWRTTGAMIKAHLDRIYPYLNGNVGLKIQRESVYYRPGLTYGKRSDRFNAQVLPAGMIPSFNGIGLYPKVLSDSWWLLAFLNTRFAAYFLNLTCGLHKNSVYVDRLPLPEFTAEDKWSLGKAAEELYRQVRIQNAVEESSNLFLVPPAICSMGESIRAKVSAWRKADRDKETQAWKLQSGIEERVNSSVPEIKEMETALIADQGPDPFRFPSKDETPSLGNPAILARWEGICRPLVNRDDGRDSTDTFRLSLARNLSLPEATRILNEAGFVAPEDLVHQTESLVSYMLGICLGRWDIRFATSEKPAPELPDPFAPLPVCPPGQLQNEQGLPITKEEVGRLKEEGRWNYPIEIPWDGILVDDPGHPLDLEARVHQILQVIWGDRWEVIEREACEILGVQALRDYFRKPSGFFVDHLKRYSKSRRQAPIYWPLSTAKGSYTLWIYYHRLSDQTLHTAMADFVDPKLKAVRAELSSLRQSATNRTRIEELLDLEKEFDDFRVEIERIIKLPWKPNLNDGVLITASPLWKLFRLPKWQKELKACWDNLARGDYDWAHLAYNIWPKRVEDACKTDRSIAIAHGLEHLCQMEPPKAKRGKKRTTVAPEELGL